MDWVLVKSWWCWERSRWPSGTEDEMKKKKKVGGRALVWSGPSCHPSQTQEGIVACAGAQSPHDWCTGTVLLFCARVIHVLVFVFMFAQVFWKVKCDYFIDVKEQSSAPNPACCLLLQVTVQEEKFSVCYLTFSAGEATRRSSECDTVKPNVYSWNVKLLFWGFFLNCLFSSALYQVVFGD